MKRVAGHDDDYEYNGVTGAMDEVLGLYGNVGQMIMGDFVGHHRGSVGRPGGTLSIHSLAPLVESK